MSFGLQSAQVQGTPYLTNLTYSLAMEQGWLALRLAPVMPVNAESTTFWAKTFAYGRTDGDVSQDGLSPSPSSAPPLSTGTFAVSPKSHSSILTERMKQNAMRSPTGFKALEESYASWPASILAMNLEKALHTLMTTTGTYFSASQYTDLSTSASLQFDSYGTSNPLATVIQYCRAIQAVSGLPRKALTITMGRAVYDVLLQHPDLADRIKYIRSTLQRDLSESDIAGFFGVKEVLVGDVIEVTSPPGITETSSFTWGKDLYISYVDPSPTQTAGTAGSFFTASVTASDNGVVGAPWASRAIVLQDPLATKYITEGIFGVNAGKITGEGVRTAAWIQNAVSSAA